MLPRPQPTTKSSSPSREKVYSMQKGRKEVGQPLSKPRLQPYRGFVRGGHARQHVVRKQALTFAPICMVVPTGQKEASQM